MQKTGNLIHEIFQDLYNFTDTEKSIVSEKYKVKGRVDALKDDILYELKTLDPPKYRGKYIKEHYYQCVIYAHILNTEYDYNISKITIVYVLRDLKKIYPFDLPPNDELAIQFLERSLILLDSISSKKTPEPIGATDTHCRFCLYKKYCEKDGYNKIKPPYIKDEQPKKKPEEKKKSVFLL
jgi:CRISPR/Cas system-associated exonuclease Cas4 (RecB family)